jgi:hypothetical protein
MCNESSCHLFPRFRFFAPEVHSICFLWKAVHYRNEKNPVLFSPKEPFFSSFGIRAESTVFSGGKNGESGVADVVF